MALKIFNNDRGWEYFKREVDMLSEVAKRPHPHIVPYLFAWKQRDKGFILFELAQYDLRFFLMENKKPKASMKFCIWFLEQIYGIADAINTVHNRGPSKTYGNTLNPDTRINRHGYFHDLKPENILVYFENNSFMNGSIKISDLGAGRMHEVVGVTDGVMDGVIDEVMARSIQSVQSTRGNRTETYESPQAYDNTGQRKFGRAEDMWAFGCVIFELLQWAFTEPSQTRRTLKSELHGPVDSETCHQFPAFYQMNTQPNGCKVAVLRPKVLEWMMVIEEGCKDEFRDVLDLVRRLLEPVEKDRLKSHELNEKLKEVLKSAKLTLEANPNHYADNITTPPSESLRVPGQSANVEGKSLSKSSTIHEEEESESETSESQEEVEVLHAAGTIPRITVG